MKLIASITLKMKKVILPQFISTLNKYGIEISMINLMDSDGKWEEYNIEVIYSSKKELSRLVESLKKNNEYFKDIVITSTLEEKIKGGVLRTSGKIPLENVNDVWTVLVGGNKLIHERIDAGFQKNYCSSFNSVAIISGIKITKTGNDNFYHLYSDSERDSVIISRFTGRNAFPIAIRYNSIEDMIKIIKGIEDNFCCIRIMNNDAEDYLFSNIIDAVSKPLLFRELDENPVHYMSVINTLVRNHSITPDDTTFGIIGLNNSTIRLTSLLDKSGFMKVLGYDADERQMMSFENRKGLATTIENVISNSDMLMIMYEEVSFDYLNSLRPGQILISGISTQIGNAEALKNKGIKEYIRIEETDVLSILPAMINGTIATEAGHFRDDMLIKIADIISRIMQKKYELPGFFSELNTKIEGFIQKKGKQ
jgi:hypothetical protein